MGSSDPVHRRRVVYNVLVCKFGLVAVVVLLLGGLCAGAENPAPNPQPYKFVSGRVQLFEAEKLTVERTPFGRAPETYVFLITPSTTIEGNIKTKSRVTVAYTPSDEGDVAVRIIVRSTPRR
jgi:hypothetical protein